MKLRTRLARYFLKLRLLVILAWISGTAWATVTLPAISGQGGSARALVPHHAPALKAEQVSARRFAFPLVSQTVVVVRNPGGLPAQRQEALLALAKRLSFGQVAGFRQIAGALPLTNSFGEAPFAREHDTTVLLYLYFRAGISASTRTHLAESLVSRQIGHRPGEFEGVTAAGPGRATRTELINANLMWIELATIALVWLVIAIHFRALIAPLLTVGTVAIAYLVADRLIAHLGHAAGITVPAEVQPVLIALIFGVITDYSVFFLSRFRALLGQGMETGAAAAQTMAEIAPIVTVAGITVAVGTAALAVAHLQFLRAFGPGLAVAVGVAMIVSVTFIPAMLATLGRWTFWPRHAIRAQEPKDPQAAEPRASHRTRRIRAVRVAVRHPIAAVVIAAAIVLGAASGLARMALGNEIVLGLPASSQVHRAYDEATAGFTPGVLEPTVVVVTGQGVGSRRLGLDRLEQLLRGEPAVAGVVGPHQALSRTGKGITVSRGGNAARYALFLRSDPLGARAMSAVRSLRTDLPRLLKRAGLPGARALVGGDSALSADTVDATLSDLARVTPTLLAAIFVVVSLFLLSLVAPVALVLTSLLAAAASLGLTVYVMQMWMGYGQITYYVVFVVAVLLVSLGSDYNVFLVGRIWQERHRRPLREAVEVAGARAARPITVAGLALALSFALLAIVPVRSFREIAFAMAVGLLIDTLVVRTILVPAVLTLLGPRSTWPRRPRRGATQSQVSSSPHGEASDRVAPPIPAARRSRGATGSASV